MSDVVLVFLLLTLNIFYTFCVSIVYFEQINVFCNEKKFHKELEYNDDESTAHDESTKEDYLQ